MLQEIHCIVFFMQLKRGGEREGEQKNEESTHGQQSTLHRSLSLFGAPEPARAKPN